MPAGVGNRIQRLDQPVPAGLLGGLHLGHGRSLHRALQFFLFHAPAHIANRWREFHRRYAPRPDPPLGP